MGSFANLGALAGASTGWVEGSDKQYERNQHRLDQEREERLLQLKNDMQVAREGTQQAHEVSQKKLGHVQGMEAQTAKDEFSTSERESEQEFDAEQGRLDRESREGIASETRDAADKKTRPKWKTGRTSGQEIRNEDGSWTTTEGEPYAVNPVTQVTYRQKNDMWVADGSERAPRLPANRKRAEKILYDEASPERMEKFESIYGYLPKESIGAAERYLESNPG